MNRSLARPATRISLLIALLLGGLKSASGQESDPAEDPGLLGEKGIPVERGRLDPAEEAALLDKPRIAEETMERLRGLREAGNPHIRRGTLISGIKEDPEKILADFEKLHEDAVRRIEGQAIEEGSPPDSAPSPAAGACDVPKRIHLEILAVTAGITLLAALAFYLSIRGSRKESARKA